MSHFRYKAFLSYSHQDRSWAEWLHRRLERYRVPGRLVGTLGNRGEIPARLEPVFKDREELPSSADLSQEIGAALAASEFLVVVCSPAAAASRWVNAEVDEFLRRRDAEHVLCFVVGGEPASEVPGSRVFPSALSGEGIAADARAIGDGRSAAFLKIVAGLIGVGFDALRQREQQRRQRRLAAITAASLAGFLIMSGLAVSAYIARLDAEAQRARAEAERLTSQRTADFMIDIFNVVDPAFARGREITAKEVLERGQAQIAALSDEPAIQGDLLHTLGVVNVGIGEYDSAVELLIEALPLQQETGDGFAVELALAEALYLRGDLDQARAHYANVLEQLEAREGGWDQTASHAFNGLGEVLVELGETTAAEQHHRRALEQARAAWGEPTAELARSQHGLGLALLYQGRFDEAEAHLSEALTNYQEVLGPDHPRVLETHNTRTALYYSSGDMQAAMLELEATAELTRRVLGPAHPSYASVLNNLGRLQLEHGDLSAAASLLQQSVDIDRSHDRDRHTDLVFSLNSLGVAHLASGNRQEARRLLEEALSLADASGHRLSGVIRMHIASIDCEMGKPSAARKLLEDASDQLARDYPAKDWRIRYLNSVEAECAASDPVDPAATARAVTSRQEVEALKGADNLFTRLARAREERVIGR